jgi:hypothetical protein
VPQPPGVETARFRELASRHLYEDKTFLSPFLSWTESPVRALKLISKSREHLSLALIDYNVLEEDIYQRYGNNNELYLIPEVCKMYRLDGLVKIHDSRPANYARSNTKPYTGRGEVGWKKLNMNMVLTV